METDYTKRGSKAYDKAEQRRLDARTKEFDANSQKQQRLLRYTKT